jgi:hypothetical protein
MPGRRVLHNYLKFFERARGGCAPSALAAAPAQTGAIFVVAETSIPCAQRASTTGST